MPQSPINESVDNVTLTILSGGNPIKDTYAVLSVDVNREVNRVATARVVLYLTQGQAADDTFEASEAGDFAPGQELEIKVGYHSREKSIFKGLVVNHGLKAGAGRPTRLVVLASDQAVKMTLAPKSRYFKDMTDSAIFSSLIGESGLSAQVDSTATSHKQVVQYQSVDWDFLVSRAEANGLLVYTDDQKVMVKKPLSTGSPELVLTYGKDVIDFDLELESRFQLPSVTCGAWDASKQQIVEGKSREPSLPSAGDPNGKKMVSVLGLSEYALRATGPLPAAELKDWAAAALLRSRLTTPRGSVTFIGDDAPRLNTLIQLAGFGKRFNGDALITGVHHAVYEGRWRTTVRFGLSPEWRHQQREISAPAAGGLLPAIRGLQNGTVKKIDADPDGEYRVQVDVPVIAPSGDGIWARLANFYATGGKGAFFLPEVGDEVVLGFLNDDPRFAIVLGMLYGKKLKPPYTADNKNAIKAIVTKNDLRLEFDDEKKVLTAKTPGGNSIVFSDEDKSITLKDQNGNKLEMTGSGITLSSAKDITIKATGKIDIQANQQIGVKATGGDLSLQGLNVNAKAQVAFSAQGAASAELKASGTTMVKGAMVMIN